MSLYTSTFTFPHSHPQQIAQILSIDPQLSTTIRTFTHAQNELVMTTTGPDWKRVRAVANAGCELVALVLETWEALADPAKIANEEEVEVRVEKRKKGNHDKIGEKGRKKASSPTNGNAEEMVNGNDRPEEDEGEANADNSGQEEDADMELL